MVLLLTAQQPLVTLRAGEETLLSWHTPQPSRTRVDLTLVVPAYKETLRCELGIKEQTLA